MKIVAIVKLILCALGFGCPAPRPSTPSTPAPILRPDLAVPTAPSRPLLVGTRPIFTDPGHASPPATPSFSAPAIIVDGRPLYITPGF